METYDKYKPSGIGWIGDIPDHWKIERAKWIFRECKDRNRDLQFSESNLLSVSEYYGVGQRAEKISQDDILNRAESLTEYKIVKRCNLVVNIMLAWKKGVVASLHWGFRERRCDSVTLQPLTRRDS
jgi:type I restriction enzyme S subunit